MSHQPKDDLHLGPLTTVFRAPLSCSQSALFMYDDFDCAGSTTSILRGPVETASAAHCFPPSLKNDAGAGRPGAYYSPGICPQGYTAACTSINRQASPEPETVLTCCPDASQGLSYQCSVGSEWSWGLCHAALDGETATLTDLKTVRCGSSLAGTEDFLWDGVAQAQSIQVRFRRQDVSLFNTTRQQAQTTTASSSTTIAPTGGQAGAATVRETGSANPSNQDTGAAHPTSTTTTTVAIIGVACGAVAVMIMAIAAWLFTRTRTISKRLGQSQQELATLKTQSGLPNPGQGQGPGDEDRLLSPTAMSPQDTFHASWQILRPPQQQPASELMGEKKFEMDATPTAEMSQDFSDRRSLQQLAISPDSPTVGKTSPAQSLGTSPVSDRSDGIDTLIAQSRGILLPDYKDPAFGDPATESRWRG
ncbi:hypothetical protein PG996_010889 [Apiospora saccharicola]|uniref:Uncharacterized protein n=1 Tax=Apiospora saccharicola TaxID=335842 RepID=A0ABR1UPW3_9PEZI